MMSVLTETPMEETLMKKTTSDLEKEVEQDIEKNKQLHSDDSNTLDNLCVIL